MKALKERKMVEFSREKKTNRFCNRGKTVFEKREKISKRKRGVKSRGRGEKLEEKKFVFK